MAPSWTALPAERGQRTPSDDASKEVRGLFVYGTLMTGFAAHTSLARGLVSAEPGQIEGHRMVHLPAGYPALFADPTARGPVRGELLCFESLEAVLPDFDHYERCDPTDPHSLYRRARVSVRLKEGASMAWCYIFADREALGALGAVDVPRGDWRAFIKGAQ